MNRFPIAPAGLTLAGTDHKRGMLNVAGSR